MSRPIGAASWPVAMLSALRALPRTVWLLGCVSLLNDAASDLVYPLLPLYLATLPGAGAQALGLIEGCAEAVASLLKLASGVLTEKLATVKKDGKNGDVSVGKTFEELETKEREAIVALTFDLDLLERWRKVSKNDQAAHVCTKRIEELRAKFDRKKS